MFGISGGELLVILVVIMIVVGPSRLPEVTATVAKWVKRARVQLTKIRQNLDDEVGEDLRDIDLTKLDPRQYDPRRMIREAVAEEMDEWKKLMSPLGQSAGTSPSRAPQPRSTSLPPPSSSTGSSSSLSSNVTSSSSISEGAAHETPTRKVKNKRRTVGGSTPPSRNSRARNLRRK